MELKENHILILLELSDMEGYSNTQLAEKLEKQTTNMSNLLKELRGMEIIYRETGRTVIEGKGYTDDPHYIDFRYPKESLKELQNFELVFRKLIQINNEDFTYRMLKSKYVDRLIEKYGFISIYNIFRNDINYQKLNKIISQCILKQPAFITEIQRYPSRVREMDECSDYPIIACNFGEDSLIGLLGNFNAIDAVIFYRNRVKNTYVELLRELDGEFLPESLISFLDLDINLSPFTSYPVNDPIRQIFTRPFERLYDDVYLIDESDYERFIQRAYVFYSHFGEILSFGMRYLIGMEIDRCDYRVRELERQQDTTDPDYWDERNNELMDCYWDKMDSLLHNEKPIEASLKMSTLYWNVTSSRIDSLCEKLTHRENRKCLGKYHIFTDGKSLKVVDLETDENIFSPDDSKEIMGTYFLIDVILDGIEDPFTYLRPCNVFADLGFKAETKTYEELLADLKSRMQ